MTAFGDDLDARYAAVETLSYPRKAAIGVVDGDRSAAVRDLATGRSFTVTVDALTEQSGSYVRRFAVHAPERDLLGLSRKVATFLAVLWGLADARLGRLNARLRAGALDVYLCRDGAGGGEQSRRSVYVFDVVANRSDLEWARTLAHEFGHFVLPGPSGFTEPESWSNGLLGERLFLGWLRDELTARPEGVSAVPFVDRDDLVEYCARQTDALVARMCARGPDRALLAGADSRAMDEATALLLHAARVHGPAVLQEVLVYLPARPKREPTALDFVAAYEAWCAGSGVRKTAFVAGVQCTYIPAGRHDVSVEAGPIEGIAAEGLEVSRGPDGGWRVIASKSGWRKFSLLPRAAAQGSQRVLVWRRR
jgi:hypothetical protein